MAKKDKNLNPKQEAAAVIAAAITRAVAPAPIAARRTRGAYPEPAHVTQALRVYAKPDTRVKPRSRRGWTTAKAKA